MEVCDLQIKQAFQKYAIAKFDTLKQILVDGSICWIVGYGAGLTNPNLDYVGNDYTFFIPKAYVEYNPSYEKFYATPKENLCEAINDSYEKWQNWKQKSDNWKSYYSGISKKELRNMEKDKMPYFKIIREKRTKKTSFLLIDNNNLSYRFQETKTALNNTLLQQRNAYYTFLSETEKYEMALHTKDFTDDWRKKLDFEFVFFDKKNGFVYKNHLKRSLLLMKKEIIGFINHYQEKDFEFTVRMLSKNDNTIVALLASETNSETQTPFFNHQYEKLVIEQLYNFFIKLNIAYYDIRKNAKLVISDQKQTASVEFRNFKPAFLNSFLGHLNELKMKLNSSNVVFISQ